MDFHNQIRVEGLARTVLSAANRKQMIDELRELGIVPNMEEALVLTEEQFI